MTPLRSQLCACLGKGHFRLGDGPAPCARCSEKGKKAMRRRDYFFREEQREACSEKRLSEETGGVS